MGFRPDDRWFPAPASTRLSPGAWRVSFKTFSPVEPFEAPWNRAVQGRFYQWKTRFYQCKLGFLTDLTKKSSLVLLTPSSFGSKIRKNTQLHQTWHLEGSILSFEVIEVFSGPLLFEKATAVGKFPFHDAFGSLSWSKVIQSGHANGEDKNLPGLVNIQKTIENGHL